MLTVTGREIIDSKLVKPFRLIIGGGSGGPDYDPPTDPRHPYQSYVWTSDGFMNVTEGSYLNFQINKIPKSMQYQFFLRYQPKVMLG